MIRSGWVVVLVVTVIASTCVPSVAVPVGQEAVLTGAAFVQKFTKEVADYYDRQIKPLEQQRATLQAQRASASASQQHQLDAQIANLDRQISDLTQTKAVAAGHEKAWRIFNAAKGIHETLTKMEDALNQSDTFSRQIVWLDRIAAEQMAQAREAFSNANTVLDWATKLKSLRDHVSQMDQQTPTPHNKQMIVGLNALFWAMSEFGDKVPSIGDFIKNYGDVGQALVNASSRLDQRLHGRSMGLLVEGRPNDGRLNAFDRQFPELAATRDMLSILPIGGVRDAYAWPNGGILIWDPASDYWHSRRDITPQELLRRYAFFATYGNLDPSPFDVLGSTTRTIGIQLMPADAVVPPGGSTTITVSAQRMDGLAPFTLLRLRSEEMPSLTGALGLGGGSGRLSTGIVEPPETVIFTAPNTENYVYRITAEMGPDEVGTIVGSPHCLVATGVRSRIEISADPDTVEPRGDGSIMLRVTDSQGRPLNAGGRVEVAGHGIEIERTIYSTGPNSGYVPFHAPQEPGRYRVTARFSGYIDAGYLYGTNAMAAEAETFVTVRAIEEARPDPIVITPTPQPQPEPPPERPEEITFGPLYLVHIIETATMYGPVEKDVWILDPGKPNEDGVLLTADGTGGWFINKTDQSMGPFTSSYQLCPVMAGLGLQYLHYGRLTIHCDPAIWGGGG
ncbi:MAG: hypothetical protein ACOX9R_19835 [Armatimonadota bacterium]|jgi:hypothetical protein